jgi:FkbM family methyltransferase
MPRIEFPIFHGAFFAKWRRICASRSFPEILASIWRRISGNAIVLYHYGLTVAFRARNLSTRSAPIQVRTASVSFSLVPEGAIAFHAWSGLRFESGELEFVLRVLRPKMTFLDLGANSGIFSLAAGQKMRGQATSIFAFEPCLSTFSALEKNLRLNRLPEIRAVRAAISDSTGESQLFVNAAFKDGLNSLRNPSHCDAEVVGCERISTIRLDDFVAHENLPRVDVMKVDVEGAELQVFQGGSQLLKRPDAPLILYEGYSWCTAAFRYHPVELIWLLESFGYEIFILDSCSGRVRRRSPGEGYDAMFVAVKPSHSAFHEIVRSQAAA